MNTPKRRISPSLVISILALFVAIGGTSYAAVKINGKNIKKGTIAGKALKKNTVTGKFIKESSLGKVPKAKVADSATSATSATNATNATNAAQADSAKTADNAEKLDGQTADELASPAGYAYIDASSGTPEVDPAYARGIASSNVTKDGSFVCISGLSFEPKSVSATIYRIGGGTTNVLANATLEDSAFCDGAEQVAVQFISAETGNEFTTPRFYIQLFR